MPKLCKDCRFFDKAELCMHESAEKSDPQSLVLGPAEITHYRCAVMRQSTCGTEARFFLPLVSRTRTIGDVRDDEPPF